MHDWLPDLTARSGRIRDTLANSIETAIRSGVFRAGETLPTQRLIADLLAIYVDTVNGAFAEAARRGLVEGKGFGVRPQPARKGQSLPACEWPVPRSFRTAAAYISSSPAATDTALKRRASGGRRRLSGTDHRAVPALFRGMPLGCGFASLVSSGNKLPSARRSSACAVAG